MLFSIIIYNAHHVAIFNADVQRIFPNYIIIMPIGIVQQNIITFLYFSNVTVNLICIQFVVIMSSVVLKLWIQFWTRLACISCSPVLPNYRVQTTFKAVFMQLKTLRMCVYVSARLRFSFIWDDLHKKMARHFIATQK